MDLRAKHRIVKKINYEFDAWYDRQKEDKGPRTAYCLLWAHYTCLVVKQEGFTTVQLQAGTCYWPRLARHQDDGRSPNLYGYEYVPGPDNYLSIARGRMPEIHVWAGIAETETIIDLTPSFFPERAMSLAGLSWPGIRPPRFLWTHVKNLPEDVIYKPDVEAIGICYSILQGRTTLLRPMRKT